MTASDVRSWSTVAEPFSPDQLAALEHAITGHLESFAEDNPVLAGIERGEPGERRWYVRMLGEQKQHFSIWLTLDQRTLLCETYFMPAPAENRDQVFEYLMRRANKLYGAGFVIGAEDAVYLRGHLDNRFVDEEELDRMIGMLYMSTEECFRPAMRLGFASSFVG